MGRALRVGGAGAHPSAAYRGVEGRALQRPSPWSSDRRLAPAGVGGQDRSRSSASISTPPVVA
jgi:hypothetical protein